MLPARYNVNADTISPRARDGCGIARQWRTPRTSAASAASAISARAPRRNHGAGSRQRRRRRRTQRVRRRSAVEAISLEQIIKRRAADPEQSRGAGDVAVGARQRVADRLAVGGLARGLEIDDGAVVLAFQIEVCGG